MKQSDILSLAINGLLMELRIAEKEISRLKEVFKELEKMDREPSLEDGAIGRPAGFVPHTEWEDSTK